MFSLTLTFSLQYKIHPWIFNIYQQFTLFTLLSLAYSIARKLCWRSLWSIACRHEELYWTRSVKAKKTNKRRCRLYLRKFIKKYSLKLWTDLVCVIKKLSILKISSVWFKKHHHHFSPCRTISEWVLAGACGCRVADNTNSIFIFIVMFILFRSL